MKRTFILLFLITMSMSSTALSLELPEDTTRLYSAPIWKIRILAKLASQFKAADSLVREQQTVILLGERALAASDSTLKVTKLELSALEAVYNLMEDDYNSQVALTKIYKKKKWKWVKVSIALTVLALANFFH